MRSSDFVKALLLVSVIGLPGSWSLLPAANQEAAAADRSGREQAGEYKINRSAALYQHPDPDSRVLTTLRRGTIVHVIDATRDWYRIESTHRNRPSGYIRRSYADVVAGASRHFSRGVFRVTRSTPVHAAPSGRSRTITRLRSGARVQVVGERGSWYRIESETGKRPPGYILASTARRVRDLE